MQPVDIRSDHLAIVLDILARHVPEAEVWVFGSRAKWLARDTSDLDLCIRAAAPIGFAHMGALREAFEESNLPYKVDVVDWATTAESFRKIIERDKVVVQKGAGMSEWTPSTLADVSLDVSYGYTESASSDNVGPRFLRITDIQNGVVDWSNVPYCPISEANHQKYRLNPGDIVVARTGNSTGENFLYRGSEDAVFASYLIRFRIDPQKADPGFVWYNLRSDKWWGFINNSKTGSAQAGANAKVLGQFPIRFPSLDEQKTIAHILGTLDDKIELNRRMNETLEAIARALFKSWFVDFDPVRAKMSGEPTVSICQRLGLTPDLLALFPDRLVDSELGEIPEGWSCSSIGNEVSIAGGATPSTTNSEYWNGEYAWVTPKDLSGVAEKVLIDSERKITQAGVKKISSGQLPTGTVLLSSRAPIGYLALAMIPVSINQGFIAMVCDTRLPNTYVLQWAIENLDAIKQRGSGTTFAEISKANFRPMAVLVPDERVLKVFHQQVMPLYEQITAKVRESETLATVRDALLPKLLSGELRVPDAEKTVELMA